MAVSGGHAALAKARRRQRQIKKEKAWGQEAIEAFGEVAVFAGGQAEKADTAWEGYEAGYKELGGTEWAPIEKRPEFGDEGYWRFKFKGPEGEVRIGSKIYDKEKIQKGGQILASDAAAILDEDMRRTYMQRMAPGRGMTPSELQKEMKVPMEIVSPDDVGPTELYPEGRAQGPPQLIEYNYEQKWKDYIDEEFPLSGDYTIDSPGLSKPIKDWETPLTARQYTDPQGAVGGTDYSRKDTDDRSIVQKMRDKLFQGKTPDRTLRDVGRASGKQRYEDAKKGRESIAEMSGMDEKNLPRWLGYGEDPISTQIKDPTLPGGSAIARAQYQGKISKFSQALDVDESSYLGGHASSLRRSDTGITMPKVEKVQPPEIQKLYKTKGVVPWLQRLKFPSIIPTDISRSSPAGYETMEENLWDKIDEGYRTPLPQGTEPTEEQTQFYQNNPKKNYLDTYYKSMGKNRV
mgnify:CR=1 FL=1